MASNGICFATKQVKDEQVECFVFVTDPDLTFTFLRKYKGHCTLSLTLELH